jgi:VWFA-related protein
VLFTHSPVSAQQPTFRARTDLVQVDVVVVDKDGNHVRGLKKEDFQLFDRRKPRPISAFDEVQHAAPGEPGAAPAFPADAANGRREQQPTRKPIGWS